MTSQYHYVILLASFLNLAKGQNVNGQQPQVRTSVGMIYGFTVADDRVKEPHDIFLGIPYATAQRWREPQPVNNLGIFNATEYGSKCPQPERGPPGGIGPPGGTSGPPPGGLPDLPPNGLPPLGPLPNGPPPNGFPPMGVGPPMNGFPPLLGGVPPGLPPPGLMDAQKPKAKSEDCLVLNVMVPQSIRQGSQKAPVLVMIHGGAFVMGGADMYPYEAVIRNIASRGIVVVTIQYRLGALGFLVDIPSKVVGNFGILDQLEALRWINRHISAFGGDPNSVTISGGSAGAMSVAVLTLMPAADGLFERAWQQSHGVYLPALDTLSADEDGVKVVNNSKTVAKRLGCNTAQSYYDCMRNTPWSQIVEQSPDDDMAYFLDDSTLPASTSLWGADWSPLFTRDWLRTRLRDRKRRPLLAGVARDEATFMAKLTLMGQPSSVYAFYDKETMTKHVPHLLALYNQQNNTALAQEAVTLYSQLSATQDPTDPLTWFEQTVKMYSDAYFIASTYMDASTAAGGGAPAYLYSFDYVSAALSDPFPWEHVAHGSDLDYQLARFDSPFLAGKTPGADDYEVAELFGKLTENFVKTGLVIVSLKKIHVLAGADWLTGGNAACKTRAPSVVRGGGGGVIETGTYETYLKLPVDCGGEFRV